MARILVLCLIYVQPPSQFGQVPQVSLLLLENVNKRRFQCLSGKYLHSFHTETLKYLFLFTQMTGTQIQGVWVFFFSSPARLWSCLWRWDYHLKRISGLWVLCVQVWDERQSHLSHDSGRHLAALHIWGRSRGREERAYMHIPHFPVGALSPTTHTEIGKYLLYGCCVYTWGDAVYGKLQLCSSEMK